MGAQSDWIHWRWRFIHVIFSLYIDVVIFMILFRVGNRFFFHYWLMIQQTNYGYFATWGLPFGGRMFPNIEFLIWPRNEIHVIPFFLPWQRMLFGHRFRMDITNEIWKFCHKNATGMLAKMSACFFFFWKNARHNYDVYDRENVNTTRFIILVTWTLYKHTTFIYLTSISRSAKWSPFSFRMNAWWAHFFFVQK